MGTSGSIRFARAIALCGTAAVFAVAGATGAGLTKIPKGTPCGSESAGGKQLVNISAANISCSKALAMLKKSSFGSGWLYTNSTSGRGLSTTTITAQKNNAVISWSFTVKVKR